MMISAIDGIFWTADADTLHFHEVGGSVDEILGYSAAEWLAQPDFWQSKLHPEDAERILHSCAEAGRQRAPHRLTYRMVAACGRAVWLQDNVKITRDGDRATMHGIMIDVTDLIEQNRQLAELNAERAHFQALYDLVPVAIWEEDWTGVLEALRRLQAQGVEDIFAHARRRPDFVADMLTRLRVLAVNRAAVEMFCAGSAEELIRRATEVFEAEAPASVFLTALDAILRGQRELEGVNKLRRLDGTPVHVMFRIALPRIDDRSARAVFCEMDISDAQIANERFEMVTRATSDVIWDFDLVNDSLWSSDGLKRIFGLDPGPMRRGLANWVGNIHPDDLDRIMRAYEASLQADSDDWEQEYRMRRGDGTYAVVRDEGFILRDAGGAAVRMVGSLVDITEQRRLEERLIQSQKLEAMGKLTGGIAHDFNNLLTVVLGNLEVLEDCVGHDPDARRHLAAATRAVDRSAELINQLLSYARQQPMVPRALDMGRQVAEMNRMIARSLGEQVEIVIEDAPDLWLCHADAAQFENALLNLCINARDAMPEGGRLTIGMRNARVAATGGQGPEPGEYVVLSVTDTGCGMDAATAGAAFEPFFTTKGIGAGSGLGLSMVQGFAQQSKGIARLRSEPGKGTVVELFLPAPKLAARPDAPVARPGPRPASGRILLVEGQVAVRDHMTDTLESLGYAVLPAATAVAATEALQAIEPIDLMLTDIVMPGGASGIALAETARQLRPDVPVIFTSSVSETGEGRGVALQAGENVLRKPLRRDELVALLRRVLPAAALPAERDRAPEPGKCPHADASASH